MVYALTYRRSNAPPLMRKAGEHFQPLVQQSARVKNVLGRQHLQSKSAVESSNSCFEHAADRVMRSPTPSSTRSLGTSRPHGFDSGRFHPLSIVRDVLRAPGTPLDAGARSFFEPRFGVDFGNVRVYTDNRARRSAQALNAQAYTIGPNVVFNTSDYSPHTTEGRRLIAHELAHVVQQGGTHQHSVERGVAQGVIQRKCTSEFPCIRTPIPPGQVRFNGCSSSQLSDYAVIPESGTTLLTPVNDVWYDTDGLWYRHHASGSEWFKIPGHCDVEIDCGDRDFNCSKCCNLAATAIYGNPRWTSDPHGTTNPFV